jgi:lysylphosphatidylglycerol synthetase-like protein (DUF2156 family)
MNRTSYATVLGRLSVAALAIAALPSRVGAEGIIPPVSCEDCRITQPRPTGGADALLQTIWNNLFDSIFVLLGCIAILMTIYAGIRYITAINSPDAIKKARQTLINNIVGVIILVAAYAIIRMLLSILNSFAT